MYWIKLNLIRIRSMTGSFYSCSPCSILLIAVVQIEKDFTIFYKNRTRIHTTKSPTFRRLATQAKRRGNTYHCLYCQAKLPYNIESNSPLRFILKIFNTGRRFRLVSPISRTRIICLLYGSCS